MSEEEILELKEQCLPEYLKHDIEEYKKKKDDKSCTYIDCPQDEIYGSINSAFIDGIITQEFADYLRKKYVFNKGSDVNE